MRLRLTLWSNHRRVRAARANQAAPPETERVTRALCVRTPQERSATMTSVCGGKSDCIEPEVDMTDDASAESPSFNDMILAQWHRPVEQTPLAKDLPRLCRRTTIFTHDGKEHTFDRRKEDGSFCRSIAESVRDVMLTLVRAWPAFGCVPPLRTAALTPDAGRGHGGGRGGPAEGPADR
eukprot:scaffold383_cov272-Pinguiococcus_pyrenoidosus.AAC.7